MAPQAVEVAQGSPAHAWVTALGGAKNLITVDACTTRLRLVVADQNAVDADRLKQLGARGMIRPSADTLQVVVGPIADQVAGDIRAALGASLKQAALDASTQIPPTTPRATSSTPLNASALAAALGGLANIADLSVIASRLSISLKNAGAMDEGAARAAGARSAVRVNPSTWHVIVGPDAQAMAQALRGG
jgi:PTS system N-acetylglucosamine-specific IIC component